MKRKSGPKKGSSRLSSALNSEQPSAPGTPPPGVSGGDVGQNGGSADGYDSAVASGIDQPPAKKQRRSRMVDLTENDENSTASPPPEAPVRPGRGRRKVAASASP